MVQPPGKANRVVGAIAGAVREAEHPQHQRRGGETHHPRVVTELEAPRVVPLGIVRCDPFLQVLHARLETVEEGQIRTQHQVPFDARARVVVALGQSQDLFSRPSTLLELRPIDVEAGEAA